MGLPDAKNMGRSVRAPWAETHEERSKIRMDGATSDEAVLRQRVEKHGGTLSVKDYGNHFIIKIGNNVAEWWPSSAKLVIDKKWSKGIHAHDVEQVAKALSL